MASFLAGCSGQSDAPPPAPSYAPSTPAEPPVEHECVSLDSHRFEMVDPCGAPEGDPGEQANRARFTYFGPLYVEGGSLTCFYQNAVCEWDRTNGDLLALRAPRLASTWLYANSGDATVVADCQGRLHVYVDGCPRLIMNTAVRDSSYEILGLFPTTGGNVISFDSAGAVVSWDIDTGQSGASAEIEGFRGEWAANLSLDRSTLIVSSLSGDRTILFDTETCEVRQTITNMPATASGWQLMADGRFAGGGSTKPAILVFDDGDVTELHETKKPCNQVAVTPDGHILATSISESIQLRPDGSMQPLLIYHTDGFAFGDDGRYYGVDQTAGPTELDRDTGERVLKFEFPRSR